MDYSRNEVSLEPVADYEQIIPALRLFVEPGGVVEIRGLNIPGNGRPHTASGYFRDLEAAASDAVALSEAGASGVYFTLNAINSALLARAPDQVVGYPGSTTADGDVERRRWLMIDFDPTRPSNISATDDEHERALELARSCRDWLSGLGWPQAILADSGNGAHLYYAIDLPAEDGGTVANVLTVVADICETAEVKVDRSVGNAARITRLPGTPNRKGYSTEDRPHRVGHVLECPNERIEVTAEQLQVFSDALRQIDAELAAQQPPDSKSKLDVAAWLQSRGVSFRKKEQPGSRGQTIYLLDQCPFNASHGYGDACIMQERDGRLGAHCFHASCSGNGWKEFRAALDPFAPGEDVDIGDDAVQGLDPNIPRIRITPDEMTVVDQAETELAKLDNVYQRGGSLVHVVRDADPPRGCQRRQNAARVAQLHPPTVRERLASAANWVECRGKKDVRTHPPEWAVKALIARGQWRGVLRLEGVTEVPVLRQDGSLLDTPGYDPATGLIFAPGREVVAVPTNPTSNDVKQAVAILDDVIADFPFAGDEYRASWFAATLTPFCRYAFFGCAPLFLFDANAPGTGKGLAADCAGIISTGRTLARTTMPSNDEEMRKRITAIALAGERMVLIDNVVGVLGCPSLDAALTSTEWTDRILGKSETTGDIPLNVTWLATANNVVLRGDILRRTIHIRLKTSEERPEERQRFRYPRLLSYVSENQPSLTAAALTILRGYCAAGRPDMGLPPLGSYESWSDLVRQAVVHAGLRDPLESRKLLRAADSTTAVLGALITTMEQLDPHGSGLTTSQLLDAARTQPSLRDVLMELCPLQGSEALPTPHQLGMKLKSLLERVVAGKCIEQAWTRTRVSQWRVVSVSVGV